MGSVEAAEKIMQRHPGVQRGRLEAEIHPWWAAKGILQKPSSLTQTSAATLGLLKRPVDAPDFTEAELEKMQAGHLANIGKMAEEGHLVIAGPMGTDGTLRGILVFRIADQERIAAMVAKDPSVAANRLEVELYEWSLPQGTLPPHE